ncbi:ECF RNA polymerase sigma factor SigK [Streptomyces sp. NPDC051776]|uniref:ECF RNA polymerase sigma factor SigK n=1 Tax=Streptomyces sp. NPDC051776 TaxID=3155414 RepID=UPI0034190FB0
MTGASAPHTSATGEADLAELVGRVANGDERAYEQVFDALAGPVLGVARRILRDPGLAEDVAQEVMLDVWRTAARFQPDRGTVATWVMTMAHHRAVDMVRSERSAADREHLAAVRDLTGGLDDVAETVETRWERHQVRRCLHALTDVQRQAITLAYYQGLTCQEVAHLVHAPLGTVKSRLRDGLIRLRDCLDGRT